jgi:hypothetical protein
MVFSKSGGVEVMRLTDSGNVGIGTSSPGAKLDVNGNAILKNTSNCNLTIQTTFGAGASILDFTGSGDATGNTRIIGGSGSTSNLSFWTGGGSLAERMRIDSSGNVGIGTASPAYKLDVSGDIRAKINSGGDGTGVLLTNSGSTNGRIDFITSDSSGRYRLDGLGDTRFAISTFVGGVWGEALSIDRVTRNVGIGTSSPSSKFVVSDAGAGGVEIVPSGTLQSYNRSTSAYQNLNLDAATILFRPSGTERMRIHASGGVSIGNTTDSGDASLNVTGSVNGGYVALADGTTAMGFATKNVVRVTPTATATFTSTVPAAGAICVLSILTSGATSRTITFGSGFKSTGTLATGTTTARYFQITFVSDGTNLLEMSRTVAIA